MTFLPKYETVIVADKRIYATDQPIRSHLILKQHYRIPQKVYDEALHAVYNPGSDFLSLTEDAVFHADADKFGRLYDHLAAKYPKFGMQTRTRIGMWGSQERVGDVYRRRVGMPPETRTGFSEELMQFHRRRLVSVRRHMRRRR